MNLPLHKGLCRRRTTCTLLTLLPLLLQMYCWPLDLTLLLLLLLYWLHYKSA
jgi:hypothetical protein